MAQKEKPGNLCSFISLKYFSLDQRVIQIKPQSHSLDQSKNDGLDGLVIKSSA